MTPVIVIGAGGHAKVVISTLRAMGRPIEAVLDEDSAKWGQTFCGIEIQSLSSPGLAGSQAIIAVGDNAARKRLASELRFAWTVAVHPSAVVDPSVQVGPGTVIFANAVVQPDTILGAHVIVNTAATIDHDCVISDFAHIAPGVHFSGGVQVGEGALVGVGSCAIPGIKIGAWATVGAGAAVVREVRDGVTVVGVPAR